MKVNAEILFKEKYTILYKFSGEENPPFIQRVFWCLSIGACTSVMVIYEKDVGRTEINVFVILAGVPFAILMCFCGVALWR